MKVQTHNRHVIHILFPISLLFVFAVSSFIVLILAADLYASTTDQLLSNDESRTALSYLTEKIRQSDTDGSLGIADIDGRRCLSLSANYNGTVYVNYIYEYDGMLKELFVKEGINVPLKSGSDIIEISSFAVDELEANMYRFTVIDSEGLETSMIIAERSRP